MSDDDLDEDRSSPARELRVSCCAESPVFLHIDHHEVDAAAGDLGKIRPFWAIYCPHSTFRTLFDACKVRYCPCCGQQLPGIRRRQVLLGPTQMVHDGGYCCATCKDRLMSCRCWPMVYNWEESK